jgi:hypothetical protein
MKRQGRPGGREKRDSGEWVLARQTKSGGSAPGSTRYSYPNFSADMLGWTQSTGWLVLAMITVG